MSAPARINLRKTKVLAVDDNPQAMDILSQILLGFAVEQTCRCQDADDAQDKLKSIAFNLVIVDDQMPRMSGFDLIASIRRDPISRNHTVPIILAAGNPSQQLVVRARDCGANLVIAKPIVPGVLLARMQWLAQNNRAFVTSETYNGPDRRFKAVPLPVGVAERRTEALRLMAAPERELSQDEISSLF